ncbi:hypothetical protein BBP40_010017 [Aspergillus hancockii]|nr:hypothetical protein BBP40_010017 [Aspergillus hancockii]
MSKTALANRIEALESQLPKANGISSESYPRRRRPRKGQHAVCPNPLQIDKHTHAEWTVDGSPENDNPDPEGVDADPSFGVLSAGLLSQTFAQDNDENSIPVPLNELRPEASYFDTIDEQRAEPPDDLHNTKRERPTPTPQEQFGMCKLFMVYAIGAAILGPTFGDRQTRPQSFFMTATELEPPLKQSPSVGDREILLLQAIYRL